VFLLALSPEGVNR